MSSFIDSIETIEGHDVFILEQQMPRGIGIKNYFTAYVKLKGKLKRSYCWETFRKGDLIGIDTNHANNQKQTLSQRRENAILQMHLLIQEHLKEVQ